VVGGDHAPSQHDLLVFSIQKQDFHQLILDILKQGTYVTTTVAIEFGRLLPDQSTAA
jgi:hypothetical protein